MGGRRERKEEREGGKEGGRKEGRKKVFLNYLPGQWKFLKVWQQMSDEAVQKLILIYKSTSFLENWASINFF